MLLQFPIDLEQYDRREQLKKSGLGKVGVSFTLNFHIVISLAFAPLYVAIITIKRINGWSGKKKIAMAR